MTFSFVPLAQAASEQHGGWMTRQLLETLTTSAEWVLWLLLVLSVLSIAVMLERALYFLTHSLPNSENLAVKISRGDLEAARAAVQGKKGMEAEVLREALQSTSQGAATVEQVIASTLSRERPQYERFLSFLGTLGSNAPFIGLFGTVLGIIKAFHDLGMSGAKGSAVQSTVMAGISEALVATAVGLGVAIPAVVAYNVFNRSLKTMTARTNALGHAVVGYLHSKESGNEPALRKVEGSR